MYAGRFYPIGYLRAVAELLAFHAAGVTEAGCDEAGRGCLAGPVTAAAVILPEGPFHPLLNDSKQLSEKARDTLRLYIEETAVSYAVASVLPAEIDEVNILNASFLAMHRALDALKLRPEHILADGNRFTPYPFVPHLCVVKGDAKYASIAAASVLAKTHRDEEMRRLHAEYPHYRWNENKGYPTAAPRRAIAEHGPCVHHRMSFALLPVAAEVKK